MNQRDTICRMSFYSDVHCALKLHFRPNQKVTLCPFILSLTHTDNMSRNRCQPLYRYLPLWHLTGADFYTDVTNCTINIKLETYIGELPTLYKTVQVQRVYIKASEKRCHCHTWSSLSISFDFIVDIHVLIRSWFPSWYSEVLIKDSWFCYVVRFKLWSN